MIHSSMSVVVLDRAEEVRPAVDRPLLDLLKERPVRRLLGRDGLLVERFVGLGLAFEELDLTRGNLRVRGAVLDEAIAVVLDDQLGLAEPLSGVDHAARPGLAGEAVPEER